ncbi:SEC-C metal-binding domain-containing protein [Parasphingopyxis sp.]|uniref:SEC-C metal-binding domain-containing protein n=1 Tax=Parasphingopyxis sp. TaxID=1920299 RepID=UPI003458231A
MATITTSRPFEVIAKRRKGFPSETQVKRGLRAVRGGEKELLEKLGRNDLCPCGSGRRFQEMLPQVRPLSMVRNGTITGGRPA